VTATSETREVGVRNNVALAATSVVVPDSVYVAASRILGMCRCNDRRAKYPAAGHPLRTDSVLFLFTDAGSLGWDATR